MVKPFDSGNPEIKSNDKPPRLKKVLVKVGGGLSAFSSRTLFAGIRDTKKQNEVCQNAYCAK